MQKLAILSLLLCLLSSCRQAEEPFSEEELAKQDSLALHIAVFPTMETLPLYYAERSGMLKEADADIRLAHYESMTDCDSALVGGTVQASFTDVARIITMQYEDSTYIQAVASTPSRLGLYAPKGKDKKKEIKRIQQLKERLVGMERHSRSDYWSDHILDGTDLDKLEIFRIQIGSTPLRYKMLNEGLLDAAFLPEPYALTMQDSAISHTIWTQPDSLTSWTVLAIPAEQAKDSLRASQVKALLDIYEKARRRIIAHPDTALLHRIYREDFLIPERNLKRAHWYEWKIAPLDSQFVKAQQEAQQWLNNERNRFK